MTVSTFLQYFISYDYRDAGLCTEMWLWVGGGGGHGKLGRFKAISGTFSIISAATLYIQTLEFIALVKLQHVMTYLPMFYIGGNMAADAGDNLVQQTLVPTTVYSHGLTKAGFLGWCLCTIYC